MVGKPRLKSFSEFDDVSGRSITIFTAPVSRHSLSIVDSDSDRLGLEMEPAFASPVGGSFGGRVGVEKCVHTLSRVWPSGVPVVFVLPLDVLLFEGVAATTKDWTCEACVGRTFRLTGLQNIDELA